MSAWEGTAGAIGGGVIGGIASAIAAKRQRKFAKKQFRTRHQTTVRDMVAAGLHPGLATGQASGQPQGQHANIAESIGKGVSSGKEAALATASLNQVRATAEAATTQADANTARAALNASLAGVAENQRAKIDLERENLEHQIDINSAGAIEANARAARATLEREFWESPAGRAKLWADQALDTANSASGIVFPWMSMRSKNRGKGPLKPDPPRRKGTMRTTVHYDKNKRPTSSRTDHEAYLFE